LPSESGGAYSLFDFAEGGTCRSSTGPSEGSARIVRHTLALVVKNLGALLASHVVNRLLYLALVAGIARVLGAEALGGYALGTAVGAAVLFATDFGLSPRLTREIAADPAHADREYAETNGVKLAASLLAFASLPLLQAVLPYPPWVKELCLLMAIAAIIESFSQINNAVCRAKERMEFEAMGAGAQAFVAVAASFYILFSGKPPVLLGWAAIAGSTAELAVSALLARRFVPLGLRLPPRWATARLATPYAVSSLNAVAFFQADLIVISLIVNQAAVGDFASVSRLLQGGGYLPVLAGASLLPTLTIAFSDQDHAAFRRVAASALRASLLLGGAAALTLLFLARPIMETIYGAGFAALAPLLRLGGFYLLAKCLAETITALLVSAGEQSHAARIRVAGAFGSWLLILVLTQLLGLTGAVLALVLSEALTCGWLATRARGLARA